MKRFIVHMHVGYAGMDGYDALVMPDDATEDEIQQEAYYMAVEHAESYGYYPSDEGDDSYCEDDEDDGWNSDKVSEGIEGYAEPYDPEVHDMHRSGGGSFEDDFKRLGG